MNVFKSFAVFAMLAMSLVLSGCGSSAMSPEEQKEYDAFNAHMQKLYVAQQQGTGDSNIVVQEPEKATTQVMVQGVVKAPGYAGDAISLEVREAEACADGYCPVEGKAPLASVSIATPGFFSLVVPSKGQKTTLVVSGSGKSAMHYLGELKAKVEGLSVTLK